ncbi:hypothetical protein NL676_002199 [Syzygium grande]|nr:hypothetical protein NL676_002199 [Syzygium grande]
MSNAAERRRSPPSYPFSPPHDLAAAPRRAQLSAARGPAKPQAEHAFRVLHAAPFFFFFKGRWPCWVDKNTPVSSAIRPEKIRLLDIDIDFRDPVAPFEGGRARNPATEARADDASAAGSVSPPPRRRRLFPRDRETGGRARRAFRRGRARANQKLPTKK